MILEKLRIILEDNVNVILMFPSVIMDRFCKKSLVRFLSLIGIKLILLIWISLLYLIIIVNKLFRNRIG